MVLARILVLCRQDCVKSERILALFKAKNVAVQVLDEMSLEGSRLKKTFLPAQVKVPCIWIGQHIIESWQKLYELEAQTRLDELIEQLTLPIEGKSNEYTTHDD